VVGVPFQNPGGIEFALQTIANDAGAKVSSNILFEPRVDVLWKGTGMGADFMENVDASSREQKPNIF
jgi:hypothetical protein